MNSFVRLLQPGQDMPEVIDQVLDASNRTGKSDGIDTPPLRVWLQKLPWLVASDAPNQSRSGTVR